VCSLLRILRDYLDLARQDHLRIDFGLPFAIGSIALAALIFSKANSSSLILEASSLTGVIVTAFTLLAGFNATSLSIFATSNSPLAQSLKEQLIEGTDRPKIEQLLAYFSWSVVFQLILLFLSITVFFLSSFLSEESAIFQNEIFIIVSWFIIWAGLIGILYSIMLTMRNVSILYYYLIADARK